MKRVTAALIRSGDRILIAKRKATEQVPLKWEFPGGKIEAGESPQECLQREIKEELSIDIEVKEFFASSVYQYEHGSIELLAYWADCSASQRVIPLVHESVEWVPIASLDAYDFAPADIPLVRKLQDLVSGLSLTTAQKEMRCSFLGGFAGQLISGVIWLGAAAISVWATHLSGMLFLFFASMAIFPLTQMSLRLMGRPAKVSPENGLWSLGSQVAFIVPVNFLLVGAATLYREDWFFPAAMIVVGSRYLPFMTLYGMKMYGLLAALLIIGGSVLGLYGPMMFSLGGWLTGGLLVGFAFLGRFTVLKEEESF